MTSREMIEDCLRDAEEENRRLRDDLSRSRGYDRRGPDAGVDWAGRNGFACRCEWASSSHGDVCPEHGKIGVPIPLEEVGDET